MKTQSLFRFCKRWFVGALALSGMLSASLEAQGQVPSTSQAAHGSGQFNLEQQRQMEHRRQMILKMFLDTHRDALGRFRPDLWLKGMEDTERLKVAPGKWKQIGPAPLLMNPILFRQPELDPMRYSGLVTDIAIDSRGTRDEVIYIAFGDGGLWKTTNGDARMPRRRPTRWKPKTDSMPSNQIGAVALDSNNPSIVYAGTGFARTASVFSGFNGGAVKGIGIYKSLDGGDTWTILNPGNIFFHVAVNRIVIPSTDVVLVATSNGLYRSVDGGAHFGSDFPSFKNGIPFFSGSFVSDLKLDTASPSTVLYAAVAARGLFRSNDAGASFPSNDNSIDNLFNPINHPGAPAKPYGNVHFDQSAFTKSNQRSNQTIYATVEFPGTTMPGFFRSINGGASWTQPGGAGLGGFQPGYDDVVGVDPRDPDRVYVGLVLLFRSTDGGTNFSDLLTFFPDLRGPLHPDFHAIAFSPSTHFGSNTTTSVFVGNDGGIGTSVDGGDNFKNINEGLATLLFRQIDIGRGSSENNEFTYGGMQDNGAAVRRGDFAGLEWHQNTAFLDGQGIAVDFSDPGNAYTTLNSGVNFTFDGGDHWGFNNVIGKFRLAVDPNSENIVYATSGDTFSPGPVLYVSIDFGVTFNQLHPFPAAIKAIAIAKVDSNIIWVALANGQVAHTSKGAGSTDTDWTVNDVNGALPLPAAGIALDPVDPFKEAVVVYEGFTTIKPTNRTRHVFRTITNGMSWTDISGTDGGDPSQNLPDLPLHSVVIDPNTSPHTIIVASDASVMRSADQGATWQIFGVRLPMVECTSLALDSGRNPSLLRVGTYGRSAFELMIEGEREEQNEDESQD